MGLQRSRRSRHRIPAVCARACGASTLRRRALRKLFLRRRHFYPAMVWDECTTTLASEPNPQTHSLVLTHDPVLKAEQEREIVKPLLLACSSFRPAFLHRSGHGSLSFLPYRRGSTRVKQ